MRLPNKLLVIGIATLLGCGVQKSDIIGMWAIDGYYGKVDYYTNTLTFEEDGSCILPHPINNENKYIDSSSTWLFFKKKGTGYVQITSENDHIAGTYELSEIQQFLDPSSGGKLQRITFTKYFPDTVIMDCVGWPEQ